LGSLKINEKEALMTFSKTKKKEQTYLSVHSETICSALTICPGSIFKKKEKGSLIILLKIK